MINFDLHIHSIASQYKEGPEIVDKSDIAHVELLLKKLNDNKVELFSITDHNRFDVKLYCKLDEIMALNKPEYSNVKGLVAGVEFDVKIDEDMKKCHIITIFDAKNNAENYEKINKVIEANLLIDKEKAYSRKEYEALLREIGLDVILIACQRSGLNRQNGSHNSLSESTQEPKELLSTGYINALEFQRPNVEGILRNNLQEVPTSVSLLMGSDCHDWEAYPYHDKKFHNKEFKHSKANILPTFKGLLMAVTSPETRINIQENRNSHYIKEISINKTTIPLVNGLNVIIGENGAGKSTILKAIKGAPKEKFVKDLIEQNNIIASDKEKNHILYIGQGDIFKNFSKNTLFPANNFLDIDPSEFIDAYTSYGKEVKNLIQDKINVNEALAKIKDIDIEYNPVIENISYFIEVEIKEDYSKIDNPHAIADKKIDKILHSIRQLETLPYYGQFKTELDQIIDLMKTVYDKIHVENEKIEIEKSIKNTIISSYNDYYKKFNSAANSRDKEKKYFEDKRQDFITCIVKAIKLNSCEHKTINQPQIMEGRSSNNKSGFKFNCELKYNDRSVIEEFFEEVFVNKYKNIESIKNIKSEEEFADAVKGCNSIDNIESLFSKNIKKFIEKETSCKKYIVDASNTNLGSTLGEMSLAYFNYMTSNNTNCSIYLVDQPEDNISNNNISKKLLSYLNSIRYKSQIILVTHNPLLVVNQDAEQVIFVKRINNKMKVVYGCLEEEKEDVNILDLIAENMDGGKSSIEKRLRVYGKEN